jgi:hypothetical protein
MKYLKKGVISPAKGKSLYRRSTGSDYTGQSSTSSANPMRNDLAAGVALRQRLIEGRLSHEDKHALMTNALLRHGLIAAPVSDSLRRAIENLEPKELRPILLDGLTRPAVSSSKATVTSNSEQVAPSGGIAPPAKKILTARRMGRPERPTDLSLLRTGMNPTIPSKSSAPFVAPGLSPGPPESPLPPRVTSDIPLPEASNLGPGSLTASSNRHAARPTDGMSPSSTAPTVVTEAKQSSNINGILRSKSVSQPT